MSTRNHTSLTLRYLPFRPLQCVNSADLHGAGIDLFSF